jgi:hypothetical protein
VFRTDCAVTVILRAARDDGMNPAGGRYDKGSTLWVISDVEVGELERFGQAWRTRVEPLR